MSAGGHAFQWLYNYGLPGAVAPEAEGLPRADVFMAVPMFYKHQARDCRARPCSASNATIGVGEAAPRIWRKLGVASPEVGRELNSIVRSTVALHPKTAVPFPAGGSPTTPLSKSASTPIGSTPSAGRVGASGRSSGSGLVVVNSHPMAGASPGSGISTSRSSLFPQPYYAHPVFRNRLPFGVLEEPDRPAEKLEFDPSMWPTTPKTARERFARRKPVYEA
eukprot:g13709.t1